MSINHWILEVDTYIITNWEANSLIILNWAVDQHLSWPWPGSKKHTSLYIHITALATQYLCEMCPWTDLNRGFPPSPCTDSGSLQYPNLTVYIYVPSLSPLPLKLDNGSLHYLKVGGESLHCSCNHDPDLTSPCLFNVFLTFPCGKWGGNLNVSITNTN